ncbi:peroxidase-related enzyme [Pseudactinotalea sp. HY158]|uniref:peroxidase-related enzyme n=1 Tax=Pseudactinotalea sp. HY158 TaxID=2654547 RepID=UPI00129C5CDA|nr:peroxidase-related enzyme [Pseudactinotalea sp. HY158]QGH69999.1 peroxidase-related enzyme [Pseudactinotalea sp. HY158]
MSTAVEPTTTVDPAPTPRADLIADLAEPGPAVAAARRAKPAVVSETAAAHAAIFDGAGTLTGELRHAIAARVAAQQGSAVLSAHHAGRTEVDLDLASGDPNVGRIVRHADLLSAAPALVTPADVADLGEHLGPDDLVLLAQLVAFTSYEARLVEGLRLLSGHEPTAPAGTAPLSGSIGERSKYRPRTAPNGRPAPREYTTEILGWESWVDPIPAEELTDVQADAFRGKTNGAYFRLLARHTGALAARTRIDHAIFATRVGLPRAERELAAAVTSRVNDCVYCASVHARKAGRLSRRVDDVARLLAAPLARAGAWRPVDLAPLSAPFAGSDERWAALVDFAAALSTTPSRATAGQVDALRALGLNDVELVDLVGSVAFFSWANRLMLTLGEPYLPAA